MAFDFDTFINAPCIGVTNTHGKVNPGLFGRRMRYSPANQQIKPFFISGDFQQRYQEVQSALLDETAINSEYLMVTLREVDMPRHYRTPLQGDTVEMDGFEYEVIDIQTHVPGSFRLILHEQT